MSLDQQRLDWWQQPYMPPFRFSAETILRRLGVSDAQAGTFLDGLTDQLQERERSYGDEPPMSWRDEPGRMTFHKLELLAHLGGSPQRGMSSTRTPELARYRGGLEDVVRAQLERLQAMPGFVAPASGDATELAARRVNPALDVLWEGGRSYAASELFNDVLTSADADRNFPGIIKVDSPPPSHAQEAAAVRGLVAELGNAGVDRDELLRTITRSDPATMDLAIADAVISAKDPEGQETGEANAENRKAAVEAGARAMWPHLATAAVEAKQPDLNSSELSGRLAAKALVTAAGKVRGPFFDGVRAQQSADVGTAAGTAVPVAIPATRVTPLTTGSDRRQGPITRS